MSPVAARARARRAAPRKRWPKAKPNPGLDRLAADMALRLKIEDVLSEAIGLAVDEARGALSIVVDQLKEKCEAMDKHDESTCGRCAAVERIDWSAVDFHVDPTPVAEDVIELLRDEGR